MNQAQDNIFFARIVSFFLIRNMLSWKNTSLRPSFFFTFLAIFTQKLVLQIGTANIGKVDTQLKNF